MSRIYKGWLARTQRDTDIIGLDAAEGYYRSNDYLSALEEKRSRRINDMGSLEEADDPWEQLWELTE